MRLAWVSIVLVTGLTPGCFSGADLIPPDIAGAQSALWIQDLGTARARAVFLGPDQQPTVVDRSRPLHVLHFDWRPDGIMELGVPFGSVRTVHNQPLPPPLMAYAWLPGQERAQVQLDALTLQSFGLPLPDIDTCALQGGCLAAEGVHRCVTPCPESQPAPPRPVDFDCPDDWLPMPGPPDSGLSLCAPEVHEFADCGADSYQGYGPDCQPLADCAAGGALWPEPPPGLGPIVYVDDDAPANGDGSIDRPFQGLVAALTIPGARILLAPGEYSTPSAFDNPGAQLVARCPTRTQLHGSQGMRLDTGPLTLSGLHLDLGSGTFSTLPGQSLTLQGVSIETSQPALTIQGALSARDLKVRAPTAIILLSGSADVSGMNFVGNQLLTCPSGTASLSDVRAQGTPTRAPMIRTYGCRAIDLERVHLDSSGADAIAVEQLPIDLRIHDAIIRGAKKNGLDAGIAQTATVTSHLFMQRVLFEELADHAFIVRGMDTVANQIVVLDSRGTAVELRQDPAQANSVEVNNLWVRATGQHLVRLGRTLTKALGTTVTGHNWVIEVPSPRADPAAVLSVRDGVVANLSQVYIAADEGLAVEVACATGTFEDLIIWGGDATGLNSQPINEITLRRMEIRERGVPDSVRNFGIRLETDRGCGRARTTLEDVRLPGCEGCGTGIFLVDNTTIRGTRVQVQGFVRGFDALEGGELLLTGGSVNGNRQGVLLQDLLGAHDRLRGVRLDNTQNVATAR